MKISVTKDFHIVLSVEGGRIHLTQVTQVTQFRGGTDEKIRSCSIGHVNYKDVSMLNWRYVFNPDNTNFYFHLNSSYYIPGTDLYIKFSLEKCVFASLNAEEYKKAVDMCDLEYLSAKFTDPEKPHGPLKAPQNVTAIRNLISDADFSIVCSNEVSVPVHSLVLKTYWPYFRILSETNCFETTEKTLKFDYPESWVLNLVGYLYGEEINPGFDELTGLMLLAELYQLPELFKKTTAEILTRPKDIQLEECFTSWHRSYQASNEPLKKHFAKLIVSKVEGEFREAVTSYCTDFSAHESLGLYLDTLELVAKRA